MLRPMLQNVLFSFGYFFLKRSSLVQYAATREGCNVTREEGEIEGVEKRTKNRLEKEDGEMEEQENK